MDVNGTSKSEQSLRQHIVAQWHTYGWPFACHCEDCTMLVSRDMDPQGPSLCGWGFPMVSKPTLSVGRKDEKGLAGVTVKASVEGDMALQSKTPSKKQS